MSEIDGKLQRILLPLDLSRDSLTALETALVLAGALDAEVSGIFIEDERLLAAASLPFAHEVGSMSGVRRPIAGADIEHSFRAIADEARSALAESGRRLNARSSFRVARGNVAAEILTAAGNSDLVVLGKAGWSIAPSGKPGSTCREVLSRSRVPILIVEQGLKPSPPILVTDDQSPAGQRALEIAKEISKRLDWELVVLGDVVLEDKRRKPRLMVLPATEHSSEHAAQVKCPILFVP